MRHGRTACLHWSNLECYPQSQGSGKHLTSQGKTFCKATDTHSQRWLFQDPQMFCRATDMHIQRWLFQDPQTFSRAKHTHSQRWLFQDPQMFCRATDMHIQHWLFQDPQTFSRATDTHSQRWLFQDLKTCGTATNTHIQRLLCSRAYVSCQYKTHVHFPTRQQKACKAQRSFWKWGNGCDTSHSRAFRLWVWLVEVWNLI